MENLRRIGFGSVGLYTDGNESPFFSLSIDLFISPMGLFQLHPLNYHFFVLLHPQTTNLTYYVPELLNFLPLRLLKDLVLHPILIVGSSLQKYIFNC